MPAPDLHLASSSPRRREILTSLGLTFSHSGVDIDESQQSAEPLTRMALRLAKEKALAAAGVDLPVLAADTIVTLGDRAFGKASWPNGLYPTRLTPCLRHQGSTACSTARCSI